MVNGFCFETKVTNKTDYNFGCGSNPRFALQYNGSNSMVVCPDTTRALTFKSIASELTDFKCKYKLGSTSTVTYQGSSKTIDITGSYTFDSTLPLYLFAWNYGASSVRYGSNKMGEFAIKSFDEETIIRDFIPCYRKSDNVIGMYDTVSKAFFTNAGTGTFTKGNNVN